MRKFLLGLIFAVLVPACANQATWTTIDGADKIIAAQKELERPAFITNPALIVRLDVDGKRIDVSSLVPTEIVIERAKGNRTIFNLSDRKNLVLFTRDGRNIKGYKLVVPIAELVPGKTIVFPVVQEPGEAVEKQLKVLQVIEK